MSNSEDWRASLSAATATLFKATFTLVTTLRKKEKMSENGNTQTNSDTLKNEIDVYVQDNERIGKNGKERKKRKERTHTSPLKKQKSIATANPWKKKKKKVKVEIKKKN